MTFVWPSIFRRTTISDPITFISPATDGLCTSELGHSEHFHHEKLVALLRGRSAKRKALMWTYWAVVPLTPLPGLMLEKLYWELSLRQGDLCSISCGNTHSVHLSEGGVKEAIYERMYNPTLNREGGLRVDLSGTWDLALPAPRTDNT
ncbi:hypothetical protein Bbelb_444980 [Branchiostoma belcheri]|nr:hypothetical protein Bbelb_444980 [Branchiostoma belcheri]